ncbi:MAG: transposase [Planctomycetota bacterium]
MGAGQLFLTGVHLRYGHGAGRGVAVTRRRSGARDYRLDSPFLEVHVEPRANGRAICSGCGEKRPGLESWCTKALRSRLAPMKKVAKSLRRHKSLILNWFLALGGISAGVVEGFNGKAKLTTRKAYGFRTPQGIEMALFHVLGRRPEPECTHRFC